MKEREPMPGGVREREPMPEMARSDSYELAQWLEREIEREAMDDEDWKESGMSRDFVRGYHLGLAWVLSRLRETKMCRPVYHD